MNTLLTLFLVQWEVESDVCTCGLAGWFNLSSNQSKNCQENGSSFSPGRDCQRNYLVAYRLTLTPQGKASHWGFCWPLEFSQMMMGAVFLWGFHSLNPGTLLKFVLWGCACPEWGMKGLWSLFSENSSQPRLAWMWAWFRPKAGRRPKVFQWARSARESRITVCNWLHTDDLFFGSLGGSRCG